MGTVTAADLSEEHVLGLPLAKVAEELVDLLGYRTLGVMTGVAQARTILDWTKGKLPKSERTKEQLFFALQVARIVRRRFSPETTRMFFSGMNPRLNDESPTMVIRERFDDHAARCRVLSTARTFLTTEG